MRRLLFVTAIAITPLVACKKSEKTDSAQHEEKLPEISIDEVEKGLADKTLTVFDCNSDKTRKKHGVLPGAVLVADEETFPASILPADKSAKLVFYCGGPGWMASHTGAGRARSFGYTNVFVMTEGSAGWQKAGKPTQQIWQHRSVTRHASFKTRVDQAAMSAPLFVEGPAPTRLLLPALRDVLMH